MTPRISVLCPTRNRPGNVARLVSSALATASGPVGFLFYQDADARGSVPDSVAGLLGVRVITGPRIVMSDMWDECLREAAADVFMMCGDDVTFNTPGWDDAVLGAIEAYPDRIALVYGRDGLREDEWASHCFVHRNWADAVGYFAPRGFSCDYTDTWLNAVADRIGRKVLLADVMFEHHHPNAGKAALDETHAERIARGQRDNVGALYESRATERERDIAALLAVMS